MSKSPYEKENKRNRREENFKRKNKEIDKQSIKANKDYKRKKQKQREEENFNWRKNEWQE